jgi:hypothetical protein
MIHRAAASQRQLVLCVFILVAAASSGRALAQGTSGTLPDPINTRELMRYADRLWLSEEQRRAIEAIHDEYRAEFRILREGEIQKFMERTRALQAAMIPRRQDMEVFITEMERINARIRMVDDKLFSRMEPILTEEQLARLPRVRMARERVRLKAQNMMGGGVGVDLSEIVLDLDLAASERRLIDSTLAAYEARLTRWARDNVAQAMGMFAPIYDILEEHGITRETMENPAEAAKAFTVIQEALKGLFLEMAASQV